MKKNKKDFKVVLIFFCFMIGNAAGLNAQNVLSGKVTSDETNKPMANVTVVVEGTSIGTISNEAGNFSLDVKSKEPVTLHFSCIGCEGLSVTTKAGDELNIRIKKETRAIDEVQITARKSLTPLEDATVEPVALMTTIQTISSKDIQAIGATNLFESMKYTVAGSLTEQGRKRRLFYSSRGQSSEIAIDGISIYQFTDVSSAISTSMIDHIENIRSSNALLAGYSGLAGVIDINTKSFDKIATAGDISYGTFNKLHANITHGGKVKNFGYALSVTKDKTDGPENRNGAEDMWNLYGKLKYEVEGKFFIEAQHFYMNGMREFAQIQSGKYSAPINNQAMIWKFDPLKFNVTLAKAKIFEGKSANTEFQFYNVDAKRRWHQRGYYVATVTNGDGSKTKVLTDSIPSDYNIANEPYKVIGGGFIQTISPVEQNYFRIALRGSKYTYPINTNYYGSTSDSDIRSFAGIITDEHSFDKTNVNAGVKLLRDYYKKYAPGSSGVYIEDEWQPVTVNVNAGISYAVSEKLLLNTQLSAGGINANPQAMKQLVEAGNTTVVPLDDENRTNLDLGIVADFGKVGKVTLSGFYTKRKNTSEYTGVLYTNGLGVETEYLDNIDTKTYGIELVWTSPVYGDWFSANANATLMRTKETTGDIEERYERSPEVMLNGGIKAEKYGFTFTANAKYISRYIGDRFVSKSSPDEKVYIGNYLNIDLALNYQLPKYPVSFFGRVINLTDKHYATMTPVYPDYGRQFSLGAKFSF